MATLRSEVSEGFKNIQEIFQLVIMSGKTVEKDVNGINFFIRAQFTSVFPMLTPDILHRTGVFVVTKCVIDFNSQGSYGIHRAKEATEFLNFAFHASVRKQAALSNIGTSFNIMKMRLVQSYISNCIQSATIRERVQSAVGREGAEFLSADNGSGEQGSFARKVFFRPQWTGEGFISKTIIHSECEKQSGVTLPRKRHAATVATSMPSRGGRNGTELELERSNSRMSGKRKRRRVEEGDDFVVAKEIEGENVDMCEEVD